MSVTNWSDQRFRSVYTCWVHLRAPRFALSHGLAQDGNEFRCEPDPARAVGSLLERVQLAAPTPVGDRTHIDVQHCGSRTR